MLIKTIPGTPRKRLINPKSTVRIKKPMYYI